MTILQKYRVPLFAADAGTGGGGAGAAAGANGAGAGAAAAAAAGGAAAPWYENKDLGLDDDTKVFIAGKKTPDLKTGLKSWMEADKHARERNVLERPDPKNIGAWKGWSELGWIEDASKYDIKAPDEKAINFKYDGELWGEFKKLAHANHIPLAAAQDMHDKMLSFWGKRIGDIEAKGAGKLKETQDALDQAWGLDKPRNVELARRAASAFGIGAEDIGELEDVIGAPRLLKMFHAIGSKLGEANLVSPDSGGAGAPRTMAELRAELNRLQSDKEFRRALHDKRHPQHKEKTAQRQAIIDKIAAIELTPQGRRAAT